MLNVTQMNASTSLRNPGHKKKMIAYFKWVDSVVCELYFKAVKAKEMRRKMGTPPLPPNVAKLKE